ncbi:MAG TPA: cupin domain-containing protein [Candidatus Saccharimonadales bacterium]|nr:cupin domain-containing protein [Candidatus Saccharimonadales bacterium]
MKVTRRDACLLLPMLYALPAAASEGDKLASGVFSFDKLAAKKNGLATRRDILEGQTATGDYLEVHETVLEPGGAPHPAHHHDGEEMFLVVRGTLQITIAGKISQMGPGSMAFVASNQEHGVHNAGTSEAQYFVLTVGAKAP